jgi:hypothetical protein
MDPEVKKEYISSVAKQINQDCSAKCFLGKSESCMETCFMSYLTVFNETTKTIRKVGFERYSRFIELVYGSGTDEWTRIVMFNDLAPDLDGQPLYYYEDNPFDPSKSK